jgi:hypothetical protein
MPCGALSLASGAAGSAGSSLVAGCERSSLALEQPQASKPSTVDRMKTARIAAARPQGTCHGSERVLPRLDALDSIKERA